MLFESVLQLLLLFRKYSSFIAILKVLFLFLIYSYFQHLFYFLTKNVENIRKKKTKVTKKHQRSEFFALFCV